MGRLFLAGDEDSGKTASSEYSRLGNNFDFVLGFRRRRPNHRVMKGGALKDWTRNLLRHPKTCVGVLAVLLLLTLLLSGGGRERKVVGDYRLEQFKDFATYYLHKRGQDDSSEGGSIIGGTVLRIGWSKKYLVAERLSIFRGDPDGWMIIEVESGSMMGPFTEADFRARPEAKGIQIYEASEAWKKL